GQKFLPPGIPLGTKLSAEPRTRRKAARTLSALNFPVCVPTVRACRPVGTFLTVCLRVESGAEGMKCMICMIFRLCMVCRKPSFRGYHANHANHAERSNHAGYRNHANHAKRSDHAGYRNHANHADHAGGREGAAVRKMYSRPAVPQHRAKARGCNTLSGVITRISWSK